MKATIIATLLALTTSAWGAAQVVVFSGPNCQGASQKLPNEDACYTYSGQSVWATEGDNGVHYSCTAFASECNDSNKQEIDYSTCYTNTGGTLYVACEDNDPLKRK